MLRGIINQIWLTWRLLRDPRVSPWVKLIPLLGVVYIISPLDFIPDFIIGVGQLDDLGIIFAALRIFEFVIPGYIVAEHRAVIEQKDKPVETMVIDAPSYRVLHRDDDQSQ